MNIIELINLSKFEDIYHINPRYLTIKLNKTERAFHFYLSKDNGKYFLGVENEKFELTQIEYSTIDLALLNRKEQFKRELSDTVNNYISRVYQEMNPHKSPTEGTMSIDNIPELAEEI